MPRPRLAVLVAVSVAAGLLVAPHAGGQARSLILGWNNLGMHCLDADFSVFSILPPYNTIAAQVVDPTGGLVSPSAGVSVTYEAVADATGSINRTSVGKTNFWDYALALMDAVVAPDMGLRGHGMPGQSNTPQGMTADAAHWQFGAEGIPITPYDDSGARNTYPMMKLVARDASGAELASTRIVLPVSDEMDCRACHASGSRGDARPPEGWVNDPDPERDYRLNVLRLHDAKNAGPIYSAALTWSGYSPDGLYATVVDANKPVLCGLCHASNGLGTGGIEGVPQLTTAVHHRHSAVTDPASGQTLDDSANRSACYNCHPGSTTQCLRGVMGKAVASDGTLAMQCQNCHGNMSAVAAEDRQGWLDEPTCQSCHTGTATTNSGQIRYTSVFDAQGNARQAADRTFATNADTPSAGLSLYRFSAGHGGLQCEACHGPTHAEYPSLEANDNVQSIAAQGHVGPMAECGSCHPAGLAAVLGGPHGLHPLGQAWVRAHPDFVDQNGTAECRACHGTDLRGTVLSYSQADRSLAAFGTKSFWRGFQIGCYACHSGPGEDAPNPNRPPVAVDGVLACDGVTAAATDLQASDPDGNALTLRIVSQPAHGRVGLADRRATYYPEAGFFGAVAFTFAAWDGSTDSNLGTVTVNVGSGPTATASGTVGPTDTPGASATAGPSPTGEPTEGATTVPSAGAIFLPAAARDGGLG